MTTAQEVMKGATESHGGLKGCCVVVVELDRSKDMQEHIKIPGISLLCHFKYEKDGVRMWKAYEIGQGKLLPYVYSSDLEIAVLKVVLHFSPRQKEPGTIQKADNNPRRKTFFSCTETNCILTFKSEKKASDHTGKHVKELEAMSLYDTIWIKWAEKVTGIGLLSDQPSSTRAHLTGQQATTEQLHSVDIGWALKVTKERKTFEDKVKVKI